MDLGRRALGRALVMLLSALLAVLATAGCTPIQPLAGDPASHADAGRERHAFALEASPTRHLTEHTLRRVPGLRGPITTCPGSQDCHVEAHARWQASAQRTGLPLDHGNGIAAHVYLGVLAFRTPAAARRFVSTVHDRFGAYDGMVRLPMTPGKGNRYTPGEDGMGTMTDLVSGRWHGWQLELRRSYTFFDYSRSADLYTHRYLVARGRFVCGGTFDARSVPELRRLRRAWPAFLHGLTAAGDGR